MSALLEIAVLCNCDEGSHTVRGAATPTPGLVISPSPHHAGQWSVTHVLSGCAAAPLCPDPEGALHVAIALGECGDWTRAGSDVALDAGMQLLRKAVLANLGLLAAARDHPQVNMSRLLKHETGAA